MLTAELQTVGPEQLQFAGNFEPVAADGRSWLAFPAGRRAERLGTRAQLALCLAVSDCGPELDELLRDLRALAPADAHIVIVEGGSTDWTLARCLRLAAEDERVVVYRAPGAASEDVLVADALALASAPLALLVPSRGRLAANLVTGLLAELQAAPAAIAAVGGSVCSGESLIEPWCGTGYVYGRDAAAAATAAPISALLGRPALFRTASLRHTPGKSLRATIADACASADVVGVPVPLSAQAAPDSRGPVDLRRFTPGAKPLALELRDFRFLCSLGWEGGPPTGLVELLDCYVSAFAPEDRVSLLIWIDVCDPDGVAEVESWLVETLRGPEQRSLDHIPDIVVQLAPLRDEDRPSLYATADCVVPLRDGPAATQVALEAMACARPVAGTPDAVVGGLITPATGFPVGPEGLGPALRAAASDPGECARRGAAARRALSAMGAAR